MKSEFENLPEFPEDHLFVDMSTVDEDPEAQSNHRAKKPKVIRPIKRDLENIRLECCRNVAGSTPNDYANKDFADRLIKLCDYFLLWTAIVPTLFYKDKIEDIASIMTASSAISEEYFKDVKKHVFVNKKHNPLVAFLKTHLNVLSGTMKLLAAMSNKYSKADSDKSDTTVSDEDIETISGISKTLEDVEEEQSEYHETSASLECERREINTESTISDDTNNNYTVNDSTLISAINPIDLSLPKITNSLLNDLSSIIKIEKIEDFNIGNSDLEMSVADLCTTHYENDDNETNLDEPKQNK
ncbi:unnamed protein product [Pieris macdunnoughi]|uniref:Uncharacterized protein n=1 Tax=Pieris macdunnoughi TaxID=345717 RepID=A0A821UGC4_9NEOP|nr:unnamed protein product [Pieris macdunnoughi]